MESSLFSVLEWGNIAVFVYFLLVQSSCLLLLILAIPSLLERVREVKAENFDNFLHSDSAPRISLIVPAFNEESCIVFTVNNLLHLSYRYKEVIIVNDGSTDRTLEILKSAFKLVPIPPSVPPQLKTQKVFNYYRSKEYPELILVDKASTP